MIGGIINLSESFMQKPTHISRPQLAPPGFTTSFPLPCYFVMMIGKFPPTPGAS
jgi:hypothetical protein